MLQASVAIHARVVMPLSGVCVFVFLCFCVLYVRAGVCVRVCGVCVCLLSWKRLAQPMDLSRPPSAPIPAVVSKGAQSTVLPQAETAVIAADTPVFIEYAKLRTRCRVVRIRPHW